MYSLVNTLNRSFAYFYLPQSDITYLGHYRVSTDAGIRNHNFWLDLVIHSNFFLNIILIWYMYMCIWKKFSFFSPLVVVKNTLKMHVYTSCNMLTSFDKNSSWQLKCHYFLVWVYSLKYQSCLCSFCLWLCHFTIAWLHYLRINIDSLIATSLSFYKNFVIQCDFIENKKSK